MNDYRWRSAFYALVLLAVARLWLTPIGSSLSLDETGTYYLATDGWSDFVAGRLPRIQSPLYTAFMHIIVGITGPNEILLRLPSILAMVLALIVLYRIAVRFADEEAGLIAVAIFIVIPFTAFAAADARPYGLAMLASLVATLMLLRWLDDGRAFDGVLYVLFAALTVHLHYLFATTLAIHAGYATMASFRGQKVSVSRVTIAAAATILLLLPLTPIIRSLMVSPRLHAFAPSPALQDFYGLLIPVVAVFGLNRLVAAILTFPDARVRVLPLRVGFWQLTFLWILVPPASLFLFSRLSGVSVFVPRYYLVSFAGISILLSTAVRMIQPTRVRRITIALLLVVGISSRGFREFWIPHGDDWRGAIRVVQLLVGEGSMPVLLQTGFVEATRMEWLTRAELRKGTLAPLVVYPLRTHVVSLPTALSKDSVTYMNKVIQELVPANRRFVLVNRGEDSLLPWVRNRLWSVGYLATSCGNFDGVHVTLFEKLAGNANDKGQRNVPCSDYRGGL
jgi:hypothetical protein